ncbi:MAG: asparaginase domain-containing protein [Bacteroidota bacterium]
MPLTFVSTGGTIDKIYFDAKSDYKIGDPQIIDILRMARVDFDYRVCSILQKDSLELTDADRLLIRETIEAAPGQHFIVTHGTDTMIETAKVLEGLGDRVIVLTGSLTPARFKQTDAEFNVGVAIGAVQALPAGVYIAMNGRIWDPDTVRKNRDENRFESVAG